MSALAQERQKAAARTPLAAVPSGPAVLGRTPFLLILAGVLVLGMVGVLLLNTSLQSRAFEVRRLQRQANELSYLRADLDYKARQLATTDQLAKRAKELGMVPNPNAVYVVVPSGEVRGTAKPVRGDELPAMSYKSPEEIAAARKAATAPLPTPAPAEVPAGQPGDGVAPPAQGGQ